MCNHQTHAHTNQSNSTKYSWASTGVEHRRVNLVLDFTEQQESLPKKEDTLSEIKERKQEQTCHKSWRQFALPIGYVWSWHCIGSIQCLLTSKCQWLKQNIDSPSHCCLKVKEQQLTCTIVRDPTANLQKRFYLNIDFLKVCLIIVKTVYSYIELITIVYTLLIDKPRNNNSIDPIVLWWINDANWSYVLT